MKSLSGKKFLQYSWNAFGFIILWWIPIIYFFGFMGILMLVAREFSLGLYELGIVLFPVPLMFVAYLADRVSNSLFVRGFIIYFFWFFIVLITSYVCVAAVGGMSMAAFENPDGFAIRQIEYIILSLKAVLFAHPVILLLTVFGTYRINKKLPKM